MKTYSWCMNIHLYNLRMLGHQVQGPDLMNALTVVLVNNSVDELHFHRLHEIVCRV